VLAQLFDTVERQMQQQADVSTQRRTERDEFIRVQYPAMTAQFSTMVSQATGTHARLAVARGVVTEIFVGRGFASLDNVQIEVRSTLYGAPEVVRFASALESVVDTQFGVFRISLENLKPRFRTDGDGPLFQWLLSSGVLMTGANAAALTIRDGNNLAPLSVELLERFLATLLVRN